ncbi:DUF4307 domain-containing protein [Microbacterium terrisoli]|jgi:hypothetical protein|uniref:DUF4307 domain-containing protein n=1 Tax=Microbacterium terrisoli TaxID=3242192 RepID=UPI00280596FD|nr:DUF4307 domain-containing protein [Microbacterium protaetiae]
MTTQQMLDERYGRNRSVRRRAWTWGVIGTVAVVAVGLLVWGTIANTINAADATATAYHVQDARAVTIDFQVSAPVGSKAVCVLEADDAEHGIVGWQVVELPASTSHTHGYSRTIPTVAEATTGLVNTCWVS